MALAVRAKAAKGAQPRNCDQSGCTRLTTAVEQKIVVGRAGISMDIYGISMDIYGISMGYLWDIYGYLWDIYGYLWDIYGYLISITQKWIPSGKFSMEKHH